ncbi:hypothetical protein [Tropicimonas sp. IMCC34011]|uniref:hypothetical protein n=1 Tax=Tropicimonas sp. IMCC34011 TaxID=2248759 RepID=UPI0018E597AE|nr:hypothetical protein [Tropicimonas sp. IMCC34011]
MPRGGKRTGAGRPKGVANKATQAQRKAVKESGLTPLDYLLQVMRDETAERAERVDAAHKAAPYVHAKLASVDHKSSDGSITPPPTTIQFIGVDGDDSEG